jgi:hypothetical protein
MKQLTLGRLGTISVEKILIWMDISYLFVGIDENGKRYVFLCENEETREYLVLPVVDEKLIEMLQSKISMRDLFLNPPCAFLVTFTKETNMVKEIDSSDIQSDMLPDSGAYFDDDANQFASYCDQLESKDIILDFLQLIDWKKDNTIHLSCSPKKTGRYIIPEYQKQVTLSRKGYHYA